MSLVTLIRRKTADMEKAKAVAGILKESPFVLGVEVFGSVARCGKGDDLDLVVVAEEDDAQAFMRMARKSALGGALCHWYAIPSSNRNAIADDLLIVGIHEIEKEVWVCLDVFVFPPDWHDRLDELQRALPHSDPQFMRKIARDAKPL